MSHKRTGEVTEDYATYIKHLAQAALAGGAFASILWAVGIWTNWYQLAFAALIEFFLTYWYFTVALVSGIVIITWILIRSRKHS